MSFPENDDQVLLLHNPRCSKSRATHALLTEKGIAFEERLYLDHPLSRAELEELAKRMGAGPGAWVRSGESAFGEAGLSPSASDAELLDAIAAHPILMERPIVLRGAHAAIGRPPENVLSLF